jgi:Transposase DDE domain
MARRIKSRKKSKDKSSEAKLTTNPDFRARSQFPLPPVTAMEARLREILPTSAEQMARMILRPGLPPKRLRERVLTLPLMAVLMVTMVWRQLPSLTEALRVLALEGLWDDVPVDVSRQALSQRLRALPASLFAQLYEEALARLRATQTRQPAAPGSLQERFTALWAADGSTLEALRRKLKELGEQETPLGGKMLAVVDLFTRRPQQTWYTEQARANDKSFCRQLLEALPVGGLVVFDLGWFGFPFFDQLTADGKFFITRLREKTAYKVVEVLGQGTCWRDEIIELGAHRSNPCRERVRLISVLWGTTWYRYLTNVLDPEKLTAREVAALYRQRWRIEEAFLLTKRLLGLAYLWVGDANGVQIQLYATWLFYAVLTDLCQQVAQALEEPLERISVEMVYRSFYHFSRAEARGYSQGIVMFLFENAKLLGLVKAKNKRQKEKEAFDSEIWDSA